MNFRYGVLLFTLQTIHCLSRPNNSSGVHENPQKLVEYIRNDYDNTMIPNISAGIPLDVKLDIYVISIEPIDQKHMKFSIQMYLRQYWKDKSLQFKLSNDSCTDYVSLHPKLIPNVWIPDTYIENEVEQDVRSRALIIFFNGQILLSERVNIRAHCPLDLKRYPMDVQECSLKFQSYNYAACQLQYSWFYEGQGDSLRLSKSIELPNYDITALSTITEKDNLKTGSFSRLVAKFQFTHKIMYVLMRDYVPAAFIVVTSWLSFYIDPAASPARVSLAVVTVLSIATQLSSTFNNTPEVSYIKAIDWYVIGCFLFVLAAMIEYGFIHSYGEETFKTDNVKTTARRSGVVNHAMTVEEFEEEDGKEITKNEQALSLDDKTNRERDRFSQYRRNYMSNFSSHPTTNKQLHQNKPVKQEKKILCLPHLIFSNSEIPCADAISRIFFPLLFLTFNVIYWFLLFATKV